MGVQFARGRSNDIILLRKVKTGAYSDSRVVEFGPNRIKGAASQLHMG